MSDRVLRLLIPAVLTAATLVVLTVRLDEPARIVFDETYYVNDARAYLEQGVEEGFAVHPPVGKWLIAAGIWLAGDDPFGWRIAGAVAGAVGVLATYLMGLRLFRRTGAAALAGLLVATDGLWFVQSRTAMLDIFLGTFVALGAWLLLVDRDAARLDAGPATPGAPPPMRGRRWRLLAGLAFGLAVATKWSGVLALVAAVSVAATWEVLRARRWGSVTLPAVVGRSVVGALAGALLVGGTAALAGAGGALVALVGGVAGAVVGAASDPVLRPAVRGLVVGLVVVPAAVYVLSYLPWFVNYPQTTEGQRECTVDGELRDPCPVSPLGRVAGWWRYQRAIWEFHATLDADHPYRAPAYTWPVLGRPVVYYWESCPPERAQRIPSTAEDGTVTVPEPCVVAEGQAAEIIAVGNPVLWWGAIGALLLVVAGAVRGDGRAGFVAAFWGAQFLPWLVVSRPVFFFYMTPAVPFLALMVAYGTRALAEGLRVTATALGAVVGAALGLAIGVPLGGSTVTRWVAMGAGWALGAVAGAVWDRRAPAEPPSSPLGAWMAAGVAVLAVATAVYFYPVWSGLPLAEDLVRQRWWIRPGWI